MSKFTAPAKDLLAALAFVKPSIANRPPVPALRTVRINPSNGEITGFDYEITSQSGVKNYAGQGEAFLAPHSVLVDAIRSTTRTDKNAEVTLTPGTGNDGQFVTVEACGYQVLIGTSPLREYPKIDLPDAESFFTIEGLALKSLINKSILAASKDDTLPILTGIKLEVENKVLTALATDRYRLSMNAVQIVQPKTSWSTSIVKAKTLAVIAKNLRSGSKCLVQVHDDWMRFNLPDGIIQTRLINGDFPKIRSLFPDSALITYTVDRLQLLDAATVAGRIAERNTPIAFKIDNDGIHSTFAEGLFGSSHAPLIPGEYLSGHEVFNFALNPAFTIDSLKSLEGKQVVIHFNSPAKPIMLTSASDDSSKQLVMPVRMPQGSAS